MKKKAKELKKRLKDYRQWLKESNKREDDVCLERRQLFRECLKQQMEIKQLEERVRFYTNQ